MLAHNWTVEDAGPERLVLTEGDDRVYIYYAGDTDAGLTRREIYLDYWSVELVTRIIEVIGDSPRLVVENEFGTTLAGDQFVTRIRTDKLWVWSV